MTIVNRIKELFAGIGKSNNASDSSTQSSATATSTSTAPADRTQPEARPASNLDSHASASDPVVDAAPPEGSTGDPSTD